MNWKVEQLPIYELSTGDTFSIKTYTLSNGVGPHVHIQASVHGAELQGNAIILRLMEQLKAEDLQGSITFIPLANPLATNNKHGTYTFGRTNPHTGDNWNRNYTDIIEKTDFDIKEFCSKNLDKDWQQIKSAFKIELENLFKDHISQLQSSHQLSENNYLNLILQKTAAKADVILDLHTGPIATEYLYCAHYEKEIAKYLNFPYVLFMPDEFAGAMDEAAFSPWIKLKESLAELGKEIELDVYSLTCELGSEEVFSMTSQSDQLEGIINFLKFNKVLSGEIQTYPYKSCELSDNKTYQAPHGGLVDYKLSPYDTFKKGDTLCSTYKLNKLDPTNPIASTKFDLIAQEDGLIINRCPSSAVQKGMELYQVMTNISSSE